MRQHFPSFCQCLLMSWMLVLPTSAWCQIIPDPIYLFEQVSWGDRPERLTWKAGMMWNRHIEIDSVSAFKTGLGNIFELRGTVPFENKEMLVACEFFKDDSGLGSLTISVASPSLPFGPDLDSVFHDEEMMDLMWSENLGRFGDPQRSMWIPFVARSREWQMDSVTIRMMRMYTPFEAFVLSYFRNEGMKRE